MMNLELNFTKYHVALTSSPPLKDIGKVTKISGQIIEGYLPNAALGSLCRIGSATRSAGMQLEHNWELLAEVVGFRDRKVLMMPFGQIRGVTMGAPITLERSVATTPVGVQVLGRILDGFGDVIDGGALPEYETELPLYKDTINPLDRPPIHEPLDLGIRAINGALTVGKGQRVGIMAGSGVGKSVLLGMMARHTKADVNVIALIGERGREVREFIERDLGKEGLARSIVVVATGDQSPLLRMRAAFVATTIAEHFSAIGKSVLLMMDSVTRFAMAQREIGLSSGEPPASKGYTPSVFATLPKLLERVGQFQGRGAITGLYTVLVEGDDMDDPIADSVRSIVDGHIVLSRRLAQRGHFPAIDILQSTSRVMNSVVSPDHKIAAQNLREMIAVYRDAEDLINVGAYRRGANPKIDQAMDLQPEIDRFLRQEVGEKADFESAQQQLVGLGFSAGY